MSNQNLAAIRNQFTLLSMALIIGFAVLTGLIAAPIKASATSPQSQVATCKKNDFLGLVPWYEYLGNNLDSKCEIKCFNVIDQGAGATNSCNGDTKSDIPKVLLAVVDDLLRIAAMVTLGFVLYGAIQFITSQGDSEGAAKARSTVINALAGLVLAMAAVTIVSFLGKKLGGT